MKNSIVILCMTISFAFLYSLLTGCAPERSSAANLSALGYIPSGWVGDGEAGERYIQYISGHRNNPHSSPTCIKIQYSPGPKGFAGIMWQFPEMNFGEKKGQDLRGFNKLTFFARGETGNELVEFKVGGTNSGKTYFDKVNKSLGEVALSKDWKKYVIDLSDEDLDNVISGFYWIASRTSNPQGLTFYLDDINYEPD